MKTVMVTGASSGIGEATARYLADEGYNLVLVARNEKKLLQLQSELSTQIEVIPFDLGKVERIEEIFIFCKEKGIKLDGLVHSAGIDIDEPIRTINLDNVMEVMRVNYVSFLELGKHFGKKKYSNDGSSIVVISSAAVRACMPGTASYAASKSALEAVVKVMSKEYLKRHIRVNSILPGFVDTPMAAHTLDDVGAKNLLEHSPLGMIEPIQIAYLVEFLLSEKTKYVTGASIIVSSGA